MLRHAKEHVKGERVQRAARELAEMLGTAPPAPSPPPLARYVQRLVLNDMGHMTFLPVSEMKLSRDYRERLDALLDKA